MGGVKSKEGIFKNEVLERLVGPTHIPVDDHFWEESLEQLSFSMSDSDFEAVAQLIDDCCEKMLKNGIQTGNFRAMVTILACAFELLPHDLDSSPDWLLNLMFLLRVFMQYILSNMSYEKRSVFFSFPDTYPDQKERPCSTHYHDAYRSVSIGEGTLNLASSSNNPSHASNLRALEGKIKVLNSPTPPVLPSEGHKIDPEPRSASTPLPLQSVSISMPFGEDMSITRPASAIRPPSVIGLAAKKVAQHEDLTSRLVCSMVHCCTFVDLNSNTYELHQELIHTFLVLISTQVYSPPDAVNPFLDVLMSSSCRPRVVELVHTLLHNFLGRLPDKSGSSKALIDFDNANVHSASARRGLFQTIGSSVKSLLLLPVSVYNYFFPPSPTAHPLADKSALLFLLLAHQQNEGLKELNPYYLALNSFCDDQLHFDTTATWDNNNTRSSSSLPFPRSPGAAYDDHKQPLLSARSSQPIPAHVLSLPFGELYDAITASLPKQWSMLLLYTLLQGNPLFQEYVFAKSDLDRIVLPLLKVLSEPWDHDKDISRIYVILIILLILSQDASFGKNAHQNLVIAHVAWYKDAVLKNISVGSLLMVVLLRTIQHNLFAHRDPYLHSNCLAALANTASHARRLHPYCAQRLIALLQVLSKKYHRLIEKASRLRQASQPPNSKKNQSQSANDQQNGNSNEQNSTQESSNKPLSSIATGGFATEWLSNSGANTDSNASRTNNNNDCKCNPSRPLSPGRPRSSSRPKSPLLPPVPSNGLDAATTEGLLGILHEARDAEGSNRPESVRPHTDPWTNPNLEIEHQTATFSEFIRLVLEIVVACLNSQAIASNSHLVYWLMYRKQLLEPFRSHPKFLDLIEHLLGLLYYFESCIEAAKLEDRSVINVLRLIEREAKQAITDAAASPETEPKYIYEEQDGSGEFFLPYIWEVVHAEGAIPAFYDDDDDDDDDYDDDEENYIDETDEKGTSEHDATFESTTSGSTTEISPNNYGGTDSELTRRTDDGSNSPHSHSIV